MNQLRRQWNGISNDVQTMQILHFRLLGTTAFGEKKKRKRGENKHMWTDKKRTVVDGTSYGVVRYATEQIYLYTAVVAIFNTSTMYYR